MNKAPFRHDDSRLRRDKAMTKDADRLLWLNEASPQVAYAVACIDEAIDRGDDAVARIDDPALRMDDAAARLGHVTD
jgi:hypothetical protein